MNEGYCIEILPMEGTLEDVGIKALYYGGHDEPMTTVSVVKYFTVDTNNAIVFANEVAAEQVADRLRALTFIPKVKPWMRSYIYVN